jgi:hypothetical protein
MTAAKKVATDFEEIIQAGKFIVLLRGHGSRCMSLTRLSQDRQRRKNESLAQEIFGRGRLASGLAAGQGPRKPGTGPSLASRVGIAKVQDNLNVLLNKRCVSDTCILAIYLAGFGGKQTEPTKASCQTNWQCQC